jgi:predicted nuclease of restriction endonuclease-like (RecB) superfamily
VPVAPDVVEIRTTLLARSDIDEIRTTLLAKSRDRIVTLFPSTLGWSHYATLIKIEDASVRAFYEIEAARQSWTVRELNRQIATMLYHRLAKSRDQDGVLALAREGQQVTTPASVLKDPLVLEFLDLPERPQWRERDLEQAIIDRLEAFLLELGRGFCFVARQKRITLDGDHFYVDLVFYNRLLRCFVLVDLKLDKLTHQDLGQMQMYVNYYDRFVKLEDEVEALVYSSEIEKDDAAKLKAGDKIQVRVIKVDVEQMKIGVSAKI